MTAEVAAKLGDLLEQGAANLITAKVWDRLQVRSGQLMIVENPDYLDTVANFSVVDNVSQTRVFSISLTNILAALSKPGIISQ